jgi:hypothetical protein
VEHTFFYNAGRRGQNFPTVVGARNHKQSLFKGCCPELMKSCFLNFFIAQLFLSEPVVQKRIAKQERESALRTVLSALAGFSFEICSDSQCTVLQLRLSVE